MGHELVPFTVSPPIPKPPVAPTALAPGFRFHPTDEELVIYYLKRKVCRKPFKFNAISDVDIYKSEPWDLACKSSLKSRDQEYYFFSALDKKYGNGARMNRATNLGYWKATGNDRPVKHNDKTVGMKKTLVFHSGRAPDGKRTNWVMHEYRLVDSETEKPGFTATQDAYVLCRVFHKSNIGPPNGHRYAPFIEEEWDDDNKLTFVPGEEAREEAVAVCDLVVGGNCRDIVVQGNGHDSVGGNCRDVVAVGNGHDSVRGNCHDVVLVKNGHALTVGGTFRDACVVANGRPALVGRDAVGIGNGRDAVGVGNGRDAVGVGNGRDAFGVGNGRDAVGVGNGPDSDVGGNGHALAFISQNYHDDAFIEQRDHKDPAIAAIEQKHYPAAVIEQKDHKDPVFVAIEQKHFPAAALEQKDQKDCAFVAIEQQNYPAAVIEQNDHAAYLGGNGHATSVKGHGHDTMIEGDDHHMTEEENVKGSTEVNVLDGRNVGHYSVQDTQTVSNALLSVTELPKEVANVVTPCKTERMDDYPMTCVVNREERMEDFPSPLAADDPQPLLSLFNQQPGILRQYKRRRHNDSNSNRSTVSETSSGLTHDPCSSTTTTASTETSVTTTTKRNFLSALVEFQLLESLEPKDKTPVAPPEVNAAMHNSSVPPSCLKFIESLQNEIHKISIEKETLKFEMLSAQAVINILQSRIDLLNKENECLKRNTQEEAAAAD